MTTISKQILHGLRKALILSLLLIVTTNAQTNYYISTSGNDSNDGKTPQTAWKTLAKLWVSWTPVQPGDSILFRRGDKWAPTTTQAPNAMLRILNKKSGTEQNPIVIGAYGTGDRPIISSENYPTPSTIQVLRTGACRFIIIRDLEFRGHIHFYAQDDMTMGLEDIKFLNNIVDGGFGGGRISFRNDYNYIYSQVPDSNHAAPTNRIELGYNTIRNTTGEDACNFVCAGDYLWVHHNSWYNCEEEALDIAAGYGHIIEYNLITGTTRQGFKIASQFNPVINATIRGNLIVRGANGTYTSGYALMAQNIKDCKIYNNTFIGGNGGYVAYLGDRDRTGNEAHFGTFEGNVIENNIFSGIVGIYGLYNDVVNQIWSRNTFRNNTYWKSQYTSYAFRINGVPDVFIHSADQTKFAQLWQSKTSATEKMEDPLFTNPVWTSIYDYGDYNLQELSPVINTAILKAEYTKDNAGNPVPQGGGADRGALERASADLTSPTFENFEISDPNTLILTFSETMDEVSAQNISNYIIDNGVIVYSASLAANGTDVTLSISELNNYTTYNLTITNVKDISGNVIDPNNSTPFSLPVVTTTQNLVMNCAFECGTFNAWSESNTIGGAVYSTAINSLTPISGSYDALISVNSAGSYNARPMMVAYLSESTTLGKVYTLTFKTKVKSGSPKIQYIYLGDQVIPTNISLSGEQSWTYTSNPVAVSRDFICFYIDGTVTGSFSIDEISYSTEAQPVLAKIKVLLQGPYNNGLMNTYLRDAGYVPTTQPYNAAPWNYSGTENVSSVPANVVDWILVELRSTTSAASLVTKQAGFLLNDGRVVAADGTSDMTFSSISEGDYYIVIKHRNHLSIMSAAAVHLSSNSAVYDFTQAGKAYGLNPLNDAGNGVFTMISGDANATGDVTASDNNLCWRPENGTVGYLCADYNLTGDVTASDRNLNWRINNGKVSQTPNN